MSENDIETVKARVAALLHENLPKGWGYHVKLRHQANHLHAAEVTPGDFVWMIWRPEDVGNALRYYRLEALGRDHRSYLLVYGNTDGGADAYDRPEAALLATEWSVARTLRLIVEQPDVYRPNAYGNT